MECFVSHGLRGGHIEFILTYAKISTFIAIPQTEIVVLEHTELYTKALEQACLPRVNVLKEILLLEIAAKEDFWLLEVETGHRDCYVTFYALYHHVSIHHHIQANHRSANRLILAKKIKQLLSLDICCGKEEWRFWAEMYHVALDGTSHIIERLEVVKNLPVLR